MKKEIGQSETFIVATKNKGKIVEIKELLAGLPLRVISMEEAGIDLEIEENGNTFEENALIKAREVMRVTGSYVMADDSGLEVEFLDGAPGIYSARFGGEGIGDAGRNAKLLELMQDVPEEKRRCRFVCAVAVIQPNGSFFTVRGTCEGRLGTEPRGAHGFGYDPLFYMPEYGKTIAEMDMQEKNAVSHRGKALRKMVAELQGFLGKTTK